MISTTRQLVQLFNQGLEINGKEEMGTPAIVRGLSVKQFNWLLGLYNREQQADGGVEATPTHIPFNHYIISGYWKQGNTITHWRAYGYGRWIGKGHNATFDITKGKLVTFDNEPPVEAELEFF
jgi:hypothetical protein